MSDENRTEKADELNRKGNDLYDSKKYKEAKKMYEKAIETDPTYVYPYLNIGLIHNIWGDKEAAKDFFKKSIEVDPQYARGYEELGNFYFSQNNYKEAIKYFQNSISVDENYHWGYYRLGQTYNKLSDEEKALEYFFEAIEKEAKFPEALNEIGIIYYYRKDYENSKKYYEMAIDSKEDFIYPYYNLGLVYEQIDKKPKAMTYYEKALQIDPNYKPAKECLKALEEEGIIKEEGVVLGILKKLGRNLNELSQKGELYECIDRDREMEGVYEVLFREHKNNPILVGHAGVGKTAIVEGIANRIVRGDVPNFMKNKQIIELTTGTLVAGTKWRGDFEARIEKILQEVKDNKNIILFIDEIHTLLGAGLTSGGNLDAAQMLKPALARGEVRLIGATTINEYKKSFEKDKAFERRFYPIKVYELSPESTKKILTRIKPRIQNHYGVNLTDENIDLIIGLCDKYMKNRYFPDKAIDILEKVSSRNGIKEIDYISDTDIKKAIEEYVGIQYLETDTSNFKRLLEMEDYMSRELFGQDEAIKKVANQIRLTKRGLDLKPERPDGVFLFAGPTGVGKTELAKVLCRFLYGNEKKLIKLDMSEFAEAHTISKLIGSPPGYVGYDDLSFLTLKIEENPSSVLILDEMEKAHLDVIRLFLQVFDEGRIRDAKGKVVFFSDVTIVMTTNALSKTKNVGFSTLQNEDDAEAIYDELVKYFPIEFLNRVDEIIQFNSLEKDNVKKIIEKKLYIKAKERFEKEDILINFDPSITELLIKEGYSYELGARNIERVFEKLVISEISNFLYSQMITGTIQLNLFVDNDDKICIKKIE